MDNLTIILSFLIGMLSLLVIIEFVVVKATGGRL